MDNLARVIKRWTIVVGILALAISVLAIWLIPWEVENLRSGITNPVSIALIFTLGSAAILLCFSLANLIKKNYMLGGMLAMIAGVLTLPAGVILLLAGLRLRAAASKLEDEGFYSSLNLKN